MATKIANAVAIGLSLDTTEFRKDINLAERLIKQVQTAYTDYNKTLQILNEAERQGKISKDELTAATNKITLASEKRQAGLREEARRVQELTEAQRQASIAAKAMQQDSLGVYTGGKAMPPGVRPGDTREVNDSARAYLGLSNAVDQAKKSLMGLDSYSGGGARPSVSSGGIPDSLKNYTDLTGQIEKARKDALEAQKALSGWENGLKRIGESKYAQEHASHIAEVRKEYEDARAGQSAWQAGLDRIANANRQAKAESDAATEAQRRLREEGAQYLQQFETRQQRINRQLAEASQYYRRGAIDSLQYAEAVRAINRQNNALIAGFNQFKGAMLTLIGPLTLLVATYEAFKSTIRLTAELDAARARFKVFTGTVSGANDILRELRDLSSTSPVSFAGSQRAISTMLQFGVATEDVVTYLKQIAEITGGDTQRMENLALAFSQTAAAGRLMGQELLQSVNAGFNPLKIISEQTGESMTDLKKRMEEGGVSFQEVAKAYRDATKEGGRFNGLLEEISGTTFGKLTRSRSELEKLGIAFGELIKPSVDGTLTNFIASVQQLTITFERLSGSYRKFDQLTIEERLNRQLGALQRLRVEAQSYSVLNTRFLFTSNERRQEVIKGYDEEIKRIKEQLRLYQSLEEVRSRMAEGGFVTQAERKAVEEDNKRMQELRKVSQDEFNELVKQRDEKLKTVSNRMDELKIRLDFVNTVGDGFFDSAKELAAMRKEYETLVEKAQTAKRVTEDFSDSLRKAREDLISARYGDDADRVKLLLKQSVGDERKTLDNLIDQGAAYKAIFDASNDIAKAEVGKLLAYEKQSAALTKQAESAKESAKRIEKLKEDLESLNSQSQFLRDSRRLGEQEARLRQLMRDDKLVRADAKRVRDAEARVKAEEKIKEIREAAIESEKSSSYSRLVDDISKLQQQLRLGFITRTQFEIERNKVIDAADRQQIQVQAPRAVQAGSAELLAMQAEKQAQAMADQFNLANRAFLLQKATADATGKTARILDEIKDNLGVLPAP